MTTFIGDFECRADAKGRIVLPATFKKAVEQGDTRFVVRKHTFENCLVIYPYNYWEEELARLRKKLNPYNREHDKFLRMFFKASAEIALDGNGRFLIPRRLMDQINGDREFVLLGVDRQIELWAKEVYDDAGDNSSDFANLAEKIMGFDVEE